MKFQRLNESYSRITGTKDELRKVYDFLKVERENAYMEILVQRGLKSPYDYFAVPDNDSLIVMNGHLGLLKTFGLCDDVQKSEFTQDDIDLYLKNLKLEFTPYDYQLKCFNDVILTTRQLNKLCTASGKSLIISLICDFFFKHNKRGLLVVPNINLLTQFKNDIKSYGLLDLYNNTDTLGGGNETDFKSQLLITTWQSMIKYKEHLDFDYLITDECHKLVKEVSSSIISESINTKYKYGFTGTLPENPSDKMYCLGLFGLPKTYITASELIERGLGTPVKINSIIFEYPQEVKNILRNSNYQKQLKIIKEYDLRNKFIVDVSTKLNGNTLILYSHTEHGKTLFTEIMKSKFPGIEVTNKDITGKKSFEFQKQYNVYFINGEDDAQTREKTRNILETCENAILVSNYAILSTGVNIRRLHNMIFASPLKSYNTITQSIGRGLRKHESKKVFTVFDLVDDIGVRHPSGVFYRQYQHRLKTSYNPEGYPVAERFFNLF